MRRLFYFSTTLLFAMVLSSFSVKSDGLMMADGNSHPPVSGLNIDSVSLLLSWQKPIIIDTAFFDDFASGSFATHGWTYDEPHWTMHMSEGNPEPSASFMSQQLQFFQSAMLTSPETEASGNAFLLNYDISFNTDTVISNDQMYVEVLEGSQWNTVRLYNGDKGSIAWISVSVDITNFIEPESKVRFRGRKNIGLNQNTYWLIDNVTLLDVFSDLPVTAYHIYLQNELIGTTSSTFYEIPPSLLNYGQNYLVGVEAVYEGGVSLREEVAFTSAYLDPPKNLQGVSVVQNVTLSWENPELHANNIAGFKLYRNNALVDSLDADTFIYSETIQVPGIHQYTITAVYDLLPYGFSGFGESLPCVAAHVSVNNFGKPVPYFEGWDDAGFATAEWIKGGNNPENWKITTMFGNPAPAAEFSWNPPVADYEAWIMSPAINAFPYNCAEISLEFDLKLQDNLADENEELLVQVYKHGFWITVKKFKNAGSFDWETHKVAVYNGTGETFYIRFLARGENSSGITRWLIDNIHAFGECRPPFIVDAYCPDWPVYQNFYIFWDKPNCSSAPSGELLKLYQWNGGPDNGHYQEFGHAYGVVFDLSEYPDAVIEHIDFHHASWGLTGTWNYKLHVVDWINHELITTIGPLSTTGNDKWEKDIHINGHLMGYGGGLIGIMLEPLGNLPMDAYPCLSADNSLNGLSLRGEVPNWSDFFSSGVGDFLMNLWVRTLFGSESEVIKLKPLGLPSVNSHAKASPGKNTNTGLQQHSMMMNVADITSHCIDVLKYHIYRSEDYGLTFYRITDEPIDGFFYHDFIENPLFHPHYYITAVFDTLCESIPSDEIAPVILLQIEDIAGKTIEIFPVPADQLLTVLVTDDIHKLQILNFLGQMVYEQTFRHVGQIHIDTSGFPPGAYIVRGLDETGNFFNSKLLITR